MTHRQCIVTFGIPLVGRQVAHDWDRVEELLNATLTAIFRQTDPNFRIVVACSDRPRLTVAADDRLEFLPAPAAVELGLAGRRADIRHKRRLLARHVVEQGGGYLVFVDADDRVSRRLVAFVRQDRHPWGYVGQRGYVCNAATGRITDEAILSRPGEPIFDHWCGTCSVLYLGSQDLPAQAAEKPSFFDRLTAVDHGFYARVCRENGRALAPLPFPMAVYVLNTGENLSETSGTPARTEVFHRLLADIARTGRPPTPDQVEEFSLPAPAAPAATPAPLPVPGKRISVAISAYGRPDGLARLLEALLPQVDGRPDREVIVVNDGTHDQAFDSVVGPLGGRIHYHPIEVNVGLPAARNLSVRLAAGDYVAFIDDDCVPPPWWLDWLEAVLEADPDIDAVAGTTRALPVDEPSFAARVNAHFGFHPKPWRSGGDLMMVGANMAVRRSLYWRLGGHAMVRGWPGAGEDSEFSRRLVLAGARTVEDPHWFVHHEVAIPIREQMRRFARYGYSDPWLNRMPTGPKGLIRPRRATWGGRLAGFRAYVRKFYGEAHGFSESRAGRFAAAVAASLIIASTDAGYARAVRELRRGAPAPRRL